MFTRDIPIVRSNEVFTLSSGELHMSSDYSRVAFRRNPMRFQPKSDFMARRKGDAHRRIRHRWRGCGVQVFEKAFEGTFV